MTAPNRLPSVTTVLGVVMVEGLSWAAARETALFAVNHKDDWADLPEIEAVERLRKHHRGIWDHRAALGTLVHTVNEAWARGDTVDLEEMVVSVQQGSHVWARMDTGHVIAEASVMVDGLEQAWLALNPTTISVEDVVRFPKPARQAYIGQSDWRAMVDGHSYLLDLKTTGQTAPKKGLYFDKWRLQLAAYRGCTEIVHYEGTERIHRPYANGAVESHTSPLPPVERAAILHIRADGAWEFIPVAAGGTEHNLFLRLRDCFTWLKGDGQKPGADPVEINSSTDIKETTAA